jgi:hypothetical protein
MVRIFKCNDSAFDAGTALANLGQMPKENRYLARALGRTLYGIAFPERLGLALWTLRHDAPDIHRDGDIEPWDLPGEVAEGSYFGFHDNGIVTMAPTGHGPRTVALSAFMNHAVGADIAFDPVVRLSTKTYVASLDEVKRIELGLTGESAALLMEVDQSLGSAVLGLVGATGSRKVTIILDGEDTDQRDSMWARMKGPMRDLADRADLGRLRKARLTVRGELSGEEEIDLLKDWVGYQEAIPAEGLTRQNAFDVTGAAYARYRADAALDE